MKQKVWEEKYRISSFLVNLRGRAGLYTMLNLIQDVGWQHAFHLEVKFKREHVWVFTRQRLVMRQWPKWNEEVTVRTWLKPPGGDSFMQRDYEIFLEDKKIGECTSTFTVIDMVTRRLAPQDWSQFPPFWMTDDLLELKPSKIPATEAAEDVASFEVRNSDIDSNHHVNNTKYAQWILDSLPIEVLRGGAELLEYEVNFLSEMRKGDVVKVQKCSDERGGGETSVIRFQGIRSTDGKTAFTARMKTMPLSL